MASLNPLRILLLGPPGSGKSFYGKMISKQWNVPFVSMGKVLKERMPEDVKREMAAGKLAPVEAVEDIYRGMQKEFSGGFILDGFPRSLEQVGVLRRVGEKEEELRPDFALHFKMNKDMIVQKLLGRRECNSCGANWNLTHISTETHYMPSILPENFDPTNPTCNCGASLHPREDDTFATISTRLNTHEENWATLEDPLRDFMKIHDIQIIGGSEVMWPSIDYKIKELTTHL